ncbi:MAG: AMIN domain-containing protein [Bdellovibrionota bacterium]
MNKQHLRYLLIFGNLIIISFAGFYLWKNTNIKEKIPFVSEFLSEEKPTPPAEPVKPKLPTTSFNSLEVKDMQGQAIVTLGKMSSGNYQLRRSPDKTKFLVEFPNTELALANALQSSPHPLIRQIQATASASGTSVRVEIDLVQAGTISEKTLGEYLNLEISKEAVVTKVQPTAPAPKSQSTSRSSVTKPAPKTASKPAPKPVVKPQPKPAPTPAPKEVIVKDSNTTDELLSVFNDEGTSSNLSDLGSAEGQGSSFSSGFEDIGNAEETLLSGSNDFDLPVLEESSELPLLDSENQLSMTDNLGSDNIAAIPRSDGKFDMDKISANLPSVSGLNVANRGNKTQISVNREEKIQYKVFAQRNPARLVIDFKNAKNQFQKEYSGFAGTKVSRATSEEFVGPEGTLIRLTLFLQDANPKNFAPRSEGNRLILEETVK